MSREIGLQAGTHASYASVLWSRCTRPERPKTITASLALAMFRILSVSWVASELPAKSMGEIGWHALSLER